MKKFISIILTVFMLAQLFTFCAFAKDTITNIHWSEDVKGAIAYDGISGKTATYKISVYKDNEFVDVIISEYEYEYAETEGECEDDIVWAMKKYGNGSYTVKIGVIKGDVNDYDDYETYENVPVITESEMSAPYIYTGSDAEPSAPVQDDNADTAPAQSSAPQEPAQPAQPSEEISAGIGKKDRSNLKFDENDLLEASKACQNAMSYCYKIGIMPNVYEDAGKVVTAEGFAKIFAKFSDRDAFVPTDSSSRQIVGPMTFEEIASPFITALGIRVLGSFSEREKFMLAVKSNLLSATDILDFNDYMTYAQLSQIVYNAYNCNTTRKNFNGILEQRHAERVFENGYEKYRTNKIEINGDTATISGTKYSVDALAKLQDVENLSFKIGDNDIKNNNGKPMEILVKDGVIEIAVPVSVESDSIGKLLTPVVKISLTIGNTTATLNGENVECDAAPIIRNGRTMLPIRFIAEALGADVSWTEQTKTVSVKKFNFSISLFVGGFSAEVTKNGRVEQVELDSPSFIENGRTYLPVRFVSENLGAKVDWNGDTQTVTIENIRE